MLRSQLCYLSTLTSDQLYAAGECKYELGGYFIVGGAEKVLLTQERLGNNMFYSGKRRPPAADSSGKRTLVEKEQASKLTGVLADEKFEYFAGVRSASEDGTKGPYSHFLVIPPKNSTEMTDEAVLKKLEANAKKTGLTDYGSLQTDRLASITLPGFSQPVPLLSVFYALGVTNDKDVYDTILAGVPESDKMKYDMLFAELVLSHKKFTEQEMMKEEDEDQDPDLLFLARQTRARSEASVFMNLTDDLFPHCEHGETRMRRKAYLLGEMTRMAMDVALGYSKTSDRDHFRFKRLDASGELCFQEFRRIYKETANAMKLKMDTRVHFEERVYSGKGLATLVQRENVGSFWQSFNFVNRDAFTSHICITQIELSTCMTLYSS
jgi:DNA-directed RNA polymerase beta subunit